MTIGRRRFMGFTVGATAGAALGTLGGGALRQLFASADSPIAPRRGPERFTLSVCDLCPGGCGVRARRIGERVVKLEGNPLHPVSGGRLCPRGQAALQGLYHPDRPAAPLRRRGARGSLASFEPASWEEAFAAIGPRLGALRGTERIALVRDGGSGLAPRLARRLLEALGATRDVLLHRGDAAAVRAAELTQGVRAAPALDLASADYVLSVGSALLEGWSSPVHSMRAYGQFRQGRTGRRGKLVQVEPRLSITGASADEWIAVRPGSEGLFAMGVAAAMVSEGLYARDFVAERTSGFEALRDLLERRYPLERVEEATGVAVHVLLRVAREFAASRASVAVGPRKGPLLPGRLFDHLATTTLNALAGSIDAPGGMLVPEEVPLAPWPVVPGRGAAAAAGPLDAEGLADAILSGAPPAVEVLLLLRADPAFASAAPERFAAAIERVPLTVSIGLLPDDTALLSDWILPEAHFLERWDLHTGPPGVPYPMVSVAPPALERPRGGARAAAEIVLGLARVAGREVAAAFPWPDLPALVRAEVDGLFRARRGAVMGTAFDEAWVRMMEGAGFWAPGYRTAEELWQRSLATGGWWDPFYDHGDWKRVLRTGTGRFEFRAELLEPPPVPPEPAPGAEEALPLLLFEPLTIAGGTGAELPFLQAILDPGHEERWETWAELHPRTSSRLAVADRDRVRLSTERGSIVVRARVTPRVVPGAVAVALGLGKKGGGRWAQGSGANPLLLLGGDRDPGSGLPSFTARVRVSRVAGPDGRI